MFTDKEVKLLNLALDKSATEGEIRNAAIAFVTKLRSRGFRYLDATTHEYEEREDYGLTVMTFGKHKGKCLKDIPNDYLIWVMESAERCSEYIKDSIRMYLSESRKW